MAYAYSSEPWHDLFVGVSGAAAVITGLATLPVMVAGASLLAGSGGGLYWLVPALILLLSVGVIYAWVLLIEILR